MNVDSTACFEISRELRDFTTEFFKQTGLNYFYFARKFDDGRFFSLHSDLNWMEHIYGVEYPACGFYIKQGKYFADQLIAPPELLHNAEELFDHTNYLIESHQHDGFQETFAFAAPKENTQVQQLYLNQPELLYRFLLYFKSTMFII